eukprot:UN29766
MVFTDLAGSEGESAFTKEFLERVHDDDLKLRRMEAGVINTGLSDVQLIFQELKG